MSHIYIDKSCVIESDTRRDQQWLAEYGAAHRRYLHILLWLMAAGAFLLLVLGGRPVFAADRVPLNDVARQSRLISELRQLEPACTYLGVRVSKEGHVWVDVRETIEPACEPSVNHTLIMKLKGGQWWARVKAPVPVNGWDAEYTGKRGWVRAGVVEVVR